MNAPKVQVDPRGCLLIVVSKGQVAPPNFTNLVSREGIAREVVRIAGGCKGLSPEFQRGLTSYFVDAFKVVDGNTVREFRGTAFSGGTAYANADGSLQDNMVTNVPAALAATYPCIAMSTTPRTADMAMDRATGGVIVDLYGGRLDFRQHATLVCQQDPAAVLDWNGDLELYLTLMEGWKMVGFSTAIITMNGGDVTREEIYGALKRGLPVIAVEGSGRETDAFIQAFRTGDFSGTAGEMRAKLKSKGKSEEPADAIVAQCRAALDSIDRGLVSIVPLGDSEALREALIARGFLS